MERETENRILQLLDVISVEVSANRSETSELRTEMRNGFSRVERRIGNLEIGDDQLKEIVLRHIPARGAFRRFKDELDRNGLLAQWFDFKRNALREQAVEWCTENHIMFLPTSRRSVGDAEVGGVEAAPDRANLAIPSID